MKNLRNPIWIFLFNSLPLCLLLLLGIGQFSIIESLLDPETVTAWQSIAIAILCLMAVNVGYAIYTICKKRHISLWFGILNTVANIALLYFYFYNIDRIIPVSIPAWMLDESLLFYTLTFLMPSIAHYMAVIVIHLTPHKNERKPWLNFLIAISIPLTIYLFVNIVVPLISKFDLLQREFMQHTVTVLFISVVVLFFFFLARAIYIAVSNKEAFFAKYNIWLKIIVALLLPIFGLIVNNNLFNTWDISDNIGVFGNFTNIWFYIIAAINGILMLLPAKDDKTYRISLFVGRSITLTYTLYFFFVFLPFLPFSIIAIIAFGTGFLMLTPLLLMIVHISELSKDFVYLKQWFSPQKLFTIALISILIIPICITGVYINDKHVLNHTLHYLYTPDYDKDYKLNINSLERTINTIRNHKRAIGHVNLFNRGTPFLSSYFKWLVLDNMTLSDRKIADIDDVFFAKRPSTHYAVSNDNDTDSVEITNISYDSRYDENQQVWRSWIDLELTNKSDLNFGEYVSSLELPEGCWISDYYLYVGDKKEFGILSEKKAAMWIYSQIVRGNNDPGTLYYQTGNRLTLKVFPFAANEVRKTGMELIHKEPIQIDIDGNKISVGNPQLSTAETIETNDVIYISSLQKETLEPVVRKPYLHFLVDASSRAKGNIDNIIERINGFVANNNNLADSAKISFVNSYVVTVPMNNDWAHCYRSQEFSGGFFLDRAIRKSLLGGYGKDSYPILVAVSDSLDKSIVYNDFADLHFTFPESSLFYCLNSSMRLEPHSLTSKPLETLSDTTDNKFTHHVLLYQTAEGDTFYLPDNNEPSIILKNKVSTIENIDEKSWLSALTMQAQWRTQIIDPEMSEHNWQHLVKNSFKAKIMMPSTSYIVVENEAQKNMLAKKQQQALSGNKSLDLGEDIERMSEPGMITTIVLIMIYIVAIGTKRANRKKLHSQPSKKKS